MATVRPDAASHPLARSAPAILAEGATVVFGRRGADPVYGIRNLDLHVPEGTVFCLLGPNGSGKTTVVNLLVGLLRPSAGHVAVAGLDPSRQQREVLRRVAVVPQETALYEQLTGAENLRFHARYYGVARKDHTDRIEGALQLVALSEAAGDRVGTYSGGMRRRLMLARALLTDPEVIFLDEPTLGVDVQSRQAIWEHITRLADEGRTVLLTTNLMEEAEQLGRELLIIDGGEPVAAGTPASLKAKSGQRRLRVRTRRETDAGRVADRLAGWSGLRRGGTDVDVALPASVSQPRILSQVLAALEGLEDEVADLHVHEPSLQDVFLQLTGRGLRDSGAAAPPLREAGRR